MLENYSCFKNHLLRATFITVSDVAGVSGRHIMNVCVHKSDTSASPKFYSLFISGGKNRGNYQKHKRSFKIGARTEETKHLCDLNVDLDRKLLMK